MTSDQFDSIVHHAQVVERYEHPSLKPLSRENFIIYDNSRRELAALRRATDQPSAVQKLAIGPEGVWTCSGCGQRNSGWVATCGRCERRVTADPTSAVAPK